MAERRMFAKTIIDSDAFLDMPLSTQAIYFHLSMRADDDGFINNPKKIQRMVGGSDDDLKLLIAKRFIIPFESGIVVIKHWKIHNYIQKDRYKETVYQDEKACLRVKDNNSYTLDTECIHDGYTLETQVRLVEDSEDKKMKNKGKNMHAIVEEFGSGDSDLIGTLYDFIDMRKMIKKPLTERALTMIINKLKKLSDNRQVWIDILNQSILHNWQDVYPLKKGDKVGATGVKVTGESEDILDGIL